MNQKPHTVYQQRLKTYVQEANRLAQISDRLGYIRLAAFLAVAVLGIYIFSRNAGGGLAFFAVFGGLFAVFVKRHDRIKAERDRFQTLALINQNELDALQHNFEAFDNGEDFAPPPTHPCNMDLDVVGKHSLYQMLNRTGSYAGRQTLADWLLAPAAKPEIESRQAAVLELSEQLDERERLRAIGMELTATERASDREALQQWLKTPFFIINSQFMTAVVYAAPVLMAATLLLWGLGMVSIVVPVVMYLFNLAFIKFSNGNVSQMVEQTAKKAPLFQAYHRLFGEVEQGSCQSPKLQNIRQRLQANGSSASQLLGELGGLSANLNVRSNMLAYLVLHTFFFWELIYCMKLERWKQKVKMEVEDWFAASGEFEALASFANLRFNHPDWAMPSILDGYFTLEANEAGHPLLEKEHCVTNSLTIDRAGKIILITGSNMAGKSTFLRTLGLNVILACAGAPVCATHFKCSVVAVYASMRIKDDLHESESAFYAELKSIKRTIEAVKRMDPPVFFLLDEILKGTNSHDRHSGSRALIKQLIHRKSSGIIATHDLALCAMEEELDGALENWCFEVDIINEQMAFDYKIKRGVCQSMNASLLMRQMGIEL